MKSMTNNQKFYHHSAGQRSSLRSLLLSISILFGFIGVATSAQAAVNSLTVSSRFAINANTLSMRHLTINDPVAFRQLAQQNAIDSIVVTGSASPDGSESWNERMATRRGNVLAGWIERHLSVPSSKIVRHTDVSNWGRLLSMIENSYDMPNRGNVEYALRKLVQERNAGSQLSDQQMTRSLRQKCSRSSWRYLTTRLLPKMRTASAVVYYHSSGLAFNNFKANMMPIKLSVSSTNGVESSTYVASCSPLTKTSYLSIAGPSIQTEASFCEYYLLSDNEDFSMKSAVGKSFSKGYKPVAEYFMRV